MVTDSLGHIIMVTDRLESPWSWVTSALSMVSRRLRPAFLMKPTASFTLAGTWGREIKIIKKESVCLFIIHQCDKSLRRLFSFLKLTLLLILSILSFSLSPALWLWPPGTILATNTPTYIMNMRYNNESDE